MNYLRGAISAASQYYKDLPPINPSTLTGAIDVIVIERPAEDGKPGDTELACSPFHVRFGKWQILRPSDKKVNVLVNGKPIPFDMKIGEAGEAFFVFETDEDVPQDLMTSPILGPTKVGAETNEADSGRFGAGQHKEDTSVDLHPEPPFLDLSIPMRSSSPVTTISRTPSPPPSTAYPSRSASPPTSLSTNGDPQHDRSASSSPFLQATDSISKAVLSLSPKEVFEKARNAIENSEPVSKIREPELEETSNPVWPSQQATTEPDGIDGIDGIKADTFLPLVRKGEGDPPEVKYSDEVALDVVGYHSNPSDSTHSLRPLESTKFEEFSHSVNGSFPPGFPNGELKASGSPRSSSTLSDSRIQEMDPIADITNLSHSRSKTVGQLDENFKRLSLSEPPSRGSLSRPLAMRSSISDPLHFPERPSDNSGRTSPASDALSSSSSSPEYSWEWGAFPVRSATDPGFSPHPSSPHLLQRAVSVPPELEGSDPSSISDAKSEGRSTFGSGGRLSPDDVDTKRFWVELEGQKFTFELSLCWPLSGTDEVADAKAFEAGKVSYQQFLDDERVVGKKDLVLKWNDRFISREDGSPLIPALSVWRETALYELSQRTPPAGLNKSSEISSAAKSHSRGSSWARWWTRNNGERTVESRPDNIPEAGPPLSRPALLVSSSAPTPTVQETIELIAGPSSIPSLTTSDSGVSRTPTTQAVDRKRYYAKTLRLTSDQLRSLNLHKGANSITFSLSSTGAVACTARIFVWDSTDRIVISDIDGTITKSDALGHVFTMIGRDWTHSGVAKLYTDICRNGYKIMYLTSRAIGQADSTREYLKGINQNNYQLPEGPVIMSPDRLIASLHREVIMRKPEVFKMACLRDIQRLFGNASRNPFYAGFGNRITDALSYRSVNVPSARIFTIDSTGEVKMELLELAGYKSSYIHMTDLVDQMFPPIHRKWTAEFTDFNYWRAPIQEFELPDLTPPSPALSARSDTSGQSRLSRLRNFSLGRPNSTQNLKVDPPIQQPDHLRSQSHSRNLSSSSSRRSLGPLRNPPTGPAEGFDEDSQSVLSWSRRQRTTSMDSSMPGSLPGSLGTRFLDEEDEFQVSGEKGEGGDGEEEEGGEEGSLGEGEVEAEAEEAFDEDLLATGEMDNIPFL